MKFAEIGAVVFGVIVGAITYRTLVRTADKTAIGDLTSVLAAIGGGVVTGHYGDANAFAWYAIGLAVGILAYFVAYWRFNGTSAIAAVMFQRTVTTSGDRTSRDDPSAGPQA
ncbi:hypothetical protein [Nocardia arizonensis]|uniref:hypothetical protein n=1 Tax=Nocardia arizonensis TaxID=1141647 RepID=UPI0006CFE3DD|nr:hypothetical protein [Nocardia arizonensis]